jgi:thioredoxin reductase
VKEYDVVVVGGGPAGLSAALVLLRARRAVVVVDAGAPRNAPASHLHGFLSRDGMPPRELLAAGRSEVSSYGGRLIDDTVIGVEPGFQVRLANASRLGARRILVATGLRDELPDIPGVRERWGKDLLHCPYCHGYEVRDLPLGVLGGTPEAVQHALLVRQWSPDVTLFPHTDTLTPEQRQHLTARGIGIVEGAVARLVVDNDQLQGVELAGGTVIPRTAVFVRPRFELWSESVDEFLA